jgi:TubC N-terminal docking domain
MKSLFDVLIEAVKRGLSLAVRDDRLSVTPDDLLTADFTDLLRAHKPELLRLLTLPFVIVQSEVLNEIVVFVADDETRNQLVSSGAKPGSIYTRAELVILVGERVTPDELLKLHEAKQIFNGTINMPTPEELRALAAFKKRKAHAP